MSILYIFLCIIISRFFSLKNVYLNKSKTNKDKIDDKKQKIKFVNNKIGDIHFTDSYYIFSN